MRAIVLAAGEGKRMRPLTANRPKVLLPAGPEPLLGRLLRQLAEAGVHDITVVTHYRAAAVEKFVGAVSARSAAADAALTASRKRSGSPSAFDDDGARWGAKATCVPQGAPRGTGHAVQAGAPPDDAPFLFLNGDVWLPEGALAAVVAAGPGSLAAAHVDEPSLYGVLELRDGRAVRVHEKSADPPSKLANAGVYHAPAGFARLLAGLKPSPRGELEVTDALQASFDKTGGWRVVEVDDWLDVGRPWDLLAAAERALAEVPEVRRGTIEAGATLKGKVVVAEGALVKAGAYVEGPVYIGARSVVGPNCYLRPGTVLLEDTKVGNGCEIKASLLMAGTHAAHLSYVGDSVLGERVNLGAGTLVANLRHDGKTVRVTQEGQRVDTRRRKLGVILGDDVHTGINTSLNVGVMLPAGAATRPGEVVMESRV